MGKDSKKRLYTTLRIFTIAVVLLWLAPLLWANQIEGKRHTDFFEVWTWSRVWLSALFALAGLFLMIKFWVSRNVRFISLVLIVFTFGILWTLPLGSFSDGLDLHPTPLCTIEKPFVFLSTGSTIPIFYLSILAAIVILNILGNKLFCGWVCPVGSLQEIVYRIPLPKKWKTKLPFRITNTIRLGIFFLFLILLFSTGTSIYGYSNPFEFFHFEWQPLTIAILTLTLIVALFIFRPFCYLICPLGLFTWLIEHIAIFRVRLDRDKCTKCNLCLKKSPCPTVPSILDGKKLRPDCHPCGRCIEVCPEKALTFQSFSFKQQNEKNQAD
ncbi:4Fe-4S binding protein [bacterium]|nr:4Fe-4S binding protein [bacterium]RQV93248.1 MAG: 4Fe-4S binding protein [bacterium]